MAKSTKPKPRYAQSKLSFNIESGSNVRFEALHGANSTDARVMRNLMTAGFTQDHDHDHEHSDQPTANAGPGGSVSADWPGLPCPAASTGTGAGAGTSKAPLANANANAGKQQGNDVNVPIPRKNWAELVNEAEHFVSDLPVLGYKPEVAPIFLNFKHIACEGYKIPLIEVASALGKVVGDSNVDGIQPMHSGWQIYIKTDKDQNALVSQGIQLAGKWISLQAPAREPGFNTNANAKIIVKNLLLNEISNDDVLHAVKSQVHIKSEVWYSNIWIDGKCTHLQNGDRFFYITDQVVSKFNKTFMVKGFQARIIKPASHNHCSWCKLTGHCPSSDLCLAKAPAEVQQTIQVFKGI